MKDSKIKKYSLCLGHISGFPANNLKKKTTTTTTTKKKTGLNQCVYHFSVDYKTFDTTDVINIHKYLMKKHDIQ